jgi:hypothetical protein
MAESLFTLVPPHMPDTSGSATLPRESSLRGPDREKVSRTGYPWTPVVTQGDSSVTRRLGRSLRRGRVKSPLRGTLVDVRPAPCGPSPTEVRVIILGAILLIIGLIASVSILVWLGIILLIVGLVLNFVPIGGTRRRYY